MAWIAKVITKSLDRGVAEVTVEYSDGVKSFQETYRNSVPTVEWIPDIVRDRISQLVKSDLFSISTGDLTPSAVVPDDPDRTLFARRVRLLEIAKLMIDLGVVLPTNAKVVALVTWIKNNFDKYFETL